MKPSTKKNNQSAQKKELSECESIYDYFKASPKSFSIENRNNGSASTGTNTKDFYIAALKKKLQKCAAEDEATIKEKEELEQENGAYAITSSAQNDNSKNSIVCATCTEKDVEIEEWKAKYMDLKKVYLKVCAHHLELDLKYHDLLKTRTLTNQIDINGTVASDDDIFSPNELKILQNMSLEKKKDSSFIHQCMEYAYKNDLSVLCGKTLKGKMETMQISEQGEVEYFPKKDPLTPKKVDRIRALFIERINKCQIDSVSYSERIKDSNINKLFASSIINIANKSQ